MHTARDRIWLAFISVVMTTTTLIAVAHAPAWSAEVPSCRGLEATIVGTAGSDELIGTAGRDVIVGLGGNDVIRSLGGNDVVCGGAGDDTIHGGRGHDWIVGGPGNDHLFGRHGHDRLFGQLGEDTLRGGLWADVCRGEIEFSCEADYRGERDEEVWRELVDEYFGDIGQTDNALVIIACESNGDPFAVNPAGQVPKGLWQFIPSTWEWATPFTGWSHEHRFHPRAATETARWLYDWADGQTRRDGSDGQGFDPWAHCRCLLPEYDCEFDTTSVATKD